MLWLQKYIGVLFKSRLCRIYIKVFISFSIYFVPSFYEQYENHKSNDLSRWCLSRKHILISWHCHSMGLFCCLQCTWWPMREWHWSCMICFYLYCRQIGDIKSAQFLDLHWFTIYHLTWHHISYHLIIQYTFSVIYIIHRLKLLLNWEVYEFKMY